MQTLDVTTPKLCRMGLSFNRLRVRTIVRIVALPGANKWYGGSIFTIPIDSRPMIGALAGVYGLEQILPT